MAKRRQKPTRKKPSDPRKAREKVYRKYFGTPDKIAHELLPLNPHIDVNVYNPRGERDCYTLVTDGMSDLPMQGADEEVLRGELIFYVDEPKHLYQSFLRYLARIPHDEGTWIWAGNTVENGVVDPEPYFPSTKFCSAVFYECFVPPELDLPNDLVIDGTPVQFLWVVPIYLSESRFIRRRNAAEFFELMQKNLCEIVFDPKRKCLV